MDKVKARAALLKTRSSVAGLLGITLLAVLYIGRLGWPDLLSKREAVYVAAYTPWLHNVILARLPSALITIVSIVLLYKLVSRWHSVQVGVLSATLFATSNWTLHTAHAANGMSMYSLVPLALLLGGTWLLKTKQSGKALLGAAALLGALLFIPGAIWFEGAALLLLQPVLKRHISKATRHDKVLASLILTAFLLLLLIRLATITAPLSQWLGLLDYAPTPMQFLKQWLHTATFLVKGPEATDLWIGHLPLLDIFSLASFLLGVFTYVRKGQNMRLLMLITFGAVASVMIAVNGSLAISYLLPLVYVVIGTGLTQLLHEWYVIFPRNPVARSVGTTVVTIAVLFAISFHLTAYFVAWPKLPSLKSVFTQQLS